MFHNRSWSVMVATGKLVAVILSFSVFDYVVYAFTDSPTNFPEESFFSL